MRLMLPDESPPARKAIFINTRRAKFADPRVRKALDLAFDFEWTNKNLFYGLYKRTDELLRKFGHEGLWQAKPRRAGAAGAIHATSCRPRCSTNPTRRR